MVTRSKAAHAFKVTKRTNRVKYVSFSFNNMTEDQIAFYREAIRKRLSRQVRQNCRFTVHTKPGYPDWFITFEHSWPERDLDRDLNAVATQQGVLMFLEPGIPEREMNTDPSSFFFRKRLPRDRPSND